MGKRFAVIGSGWRAEFYVRIGLHPGNDFELTGLLCRSEAKQRSLEERYGFRPVLTEEEILAGEPDFVVVAVNKASIAEVSAHWQALGFPVLCETPAGLTTEVLTQIRQRAQQCPMPLMVAEQYRYYPTYRKLLELVESGCLGQIVSVSVSLAHEYHGASLLRQILGEPWDADYRIRVQRYTLPVTKTGDRYHIYTDGEEIRRVRTTATVEFADGKFALYDFDPEQYHSVIRHNRIHITGTRGEVMNETLWYLDETNQVRQERWTEDIQSVRDPAPAGDLSQDESAILALMEQVWPVSRAARGKAPWTPEAQRFREENLCCALADAAFMLLLQNAGDDWAEGPHL